MEQLTFIYDGVHFSVHVCLLIEYEFKMLNLIYV